MQGRGAKEKSSSGNGLYVPVLGLATNERGFLWWWLSKVVQESDAHMKCQCKLGVSNRGFSAGKQCKSIQKLA